MLLYFLRLEEYFSVIICTFYIIDCVQGLEFFHCNFYIIRLEKNHFGPKSIQRCMSFTEKIVVGIYSAKDSFIYTGYWCGLRGGKVEAYVILALFSDNPKDFLENHTKPHLKLIWMIKSIILPNPVGLLAGVTAPESHHLLELEHPLGQGCNIERIF